MLSEISDNSRSRQIDWFKDAYGKVEKDNDDTWFLILKSFFAVSLEWF